MSTELDDAIERFQENGGLPVLEQTRTLDAFTKCMRRLHSNETKIVPYAETPGATLSTIDLFGVAGVAMMHREMLEWVWLEEPRTVLQ